MSVENTLFSASGEEVITQTIDVEVDDTADNLKSSAEFNAFYEIERTAREIEEGDFKRVALQFPDELLHDSVQIFQRLKRKIGPDKELYVLADTSYGRQASSPLTLVSFGSTSSCCVDEVAAQHIDANALVHYGHACMSQTYRLPVIYVFGKKPIDVEDCVARFVECLTSDTSKSSRSEKIILRHDVAYAHQAEIIVDRLRKALANLSSQLIYTSIPNKLLPPKRREDSRNTLGETNQDCTIFYAGEESLGLTNLLLTHSSCDIYRYSPTFRTCRLESGRTNKLLMRRYATMQKGRDSDVFGILVGTLGVGSYLPLIKHIRTLLAASQKKSYTISVGKLNPSKLANFMEIECFVLVACPENSLIDAKDFYRPIITPYELEVALQAEQSWTGKYILDFEELLAEYDLDDRAEAVSPVQNKGEDKNEDSPVFSLVTGKYRHAKRFGPTTNEPNVSSSSSSSLALVQRSQDNTLTLLNDSAAGQFLQSRTYQGLEPRLGQDAPSALEQGRSGIARGYGSPAEEGKS
ncbi:putative diphthamide synthesis protein-domain-containing protein [Lentinula aciculospora]|uniref:2-(3-amino-3-carboxypropyl)histidine synthase subunit 2 n=1 Tax=Lentinula aciculospora TaxID=153920 RepID=A0A9W9DX56_9AGAR|nr:putative diphthamide synthesis protein-domain-containing protein [Lentinula aciculospora]